MRRGVLNRAVCALCSAGLNGLLAAGVAMIVLINAPVRLPDAVGTQVENRLQALVPELDFDFGALFFQISEGGRPRLQLRDVRIKTAQGERLADLSDMGVSLALRPLLKGQVQPKRLWVSGAVGLLRRQPDGLVQVSLGADAPALGSAADLPSLIKQWDQLFELPLMASLREVDLRGLTFRYEDASRDWAASLDGGWMSIQRREAQLTTTGGFSLLSGGDYASTLTLSFSSRIGTPQAGFSVEVSDVAARDLAAQSPGLAWMSVLRAPISGRIVGRVRHSGRLAPLWAELQLGAGSIQPDPAAYPLPIRGGSARLSYDPELELLRFDALSVDSPFLSAAAAGEAVVTLKPGLSTLDQLTGQFAVTEMRLNAQGLYDEALYLQGLSSDFRLSLDPFRLELAGAQITDGDMRLRLDGDMRSGPDGWGGSARAALDRITPDKVLKYWPVVFGPKLRPWLEQNISGGEITDVDAALHLVPGARPDWAIGFDFDGVQVRYLKNMPPVVDVAGQASLVGTRFSVTATRGRVETGPHGGLDVAGTSFIVPDTDIKPNTPAELRLTAAGPVSAALALLDREPLRIMQKANLPVDLAEGQLTAQGILTLPMSKKVPPERIRYDLSGHITDLYSDVLVPGHEVAADQVTLTGSHEEVILSGPVSFSGIPAEATWRQPLRLGQKTAPPSLLQAEAALSPVLADALALDLPPGMMAGSAPARVEVDLGAGAPPALRVRSDLRGLALSVPSLGWRKQAGTAGRLELDMTLGVRAAIDRLAVEGNGLVLEAQATLADGAMQEARFDPFRIGNWLDLRGRAIGRGTGREPDIEVTGGTLDLRGLKPFAGPKGGDPGALRLALDRLTLAGGLWIDAFEGQFTQDPGLRGPFSGALNGMAGLSGQITPDGRGLRVRAGSSRAGAVLRAAKVLRRAEGGALDLVLVVSPDGAIDGQARIKDITVRDAPTLAALLNTISIVGLVNELGGQGLLFNRVDARFGVAPDGVVSLYQGSAEGASVGISVDGTVDTARALLDLRGVVSPIYMVNAVGSLISRRGEGIVGVNYRLSGPASDPRVDVNPLSVLTPALLREIFRTKRAPTAPGSHRALLPEPPPVPPRETRPEDR